MITIGRITTVVCSGFLLLSCVSASSSLPPVTVDQTFETRVKTFWNSLGADQRVTFYLKTFDHGGKVAVCGVAVATDGTTMDDLLSRWLDHAYVYVRSRSVKIVRAGFIGQTWESKKTKTANCVKSDVTATNDMLDYPANLTGGSVTNR